MRDTEQIVRTLTEKQSELGEADGLFAARLGVTRQAWQMARTGDTTPGERMLRGAAQAFPELTRDILDLFLPRNASMLTNDGKRTEEATP